MFKWLGSLVDSNEKELKKLQPTIERINRLEADFQHLSDADLGAKTAAFKGRIAQATAEVRGQIEEARSSLEEARQQLAAAEAEARVELAAHIQRLEERLKELDGELQKAEGEALNDLLPEAFAVVREAARREIKQRHFDVQLIGGLVLHQGKIAEMKTGEGKTLVATLPLYLNSLTGRGCHLATVNDYLARRDPYWMGPIYHCLGVSVASIYPQQSTGEYSPALLYDPAFDSGDPRWKHFRPVTRQEAYKADITYGTSAEFGFDYLRDNMVVELAQCVQRPLHYAIVDEVDNLLIDEARTPLIISGRAEAAGQTYQSVDDAVGRMKMKVVAHEPVTAEEKEEDARLEEQYDYIAYEKSHSVKETPRGQDKLARAFGMKVEDLFGGEGEESLKLSFEEAKKRNDILSIFRKSMSAHALYKKDRDYVVTPEQEVIIVDEFTGRLMIGRRYSDGLHQAIEAKERVKVQQETRTYATITIQNYFRMYHKLAGMTGTAATEAEEFHKIYKLDVVAIPTNKPMLRDDFSDVVYKDEAAKFKAVAGEIEALHKEGRPVLIGTVSIEKSELLSDHLKRKGIDHRILNAKQHEKEAEIIAQAGRPGKVTVATNMAGRGVDIILGGNPEGREPKEWQEEHDRVIQRGGLHIVGTERHEARRIDNQLRGRAGRQGDPGSSRFYVSLEDDVMRRFGGDRVKGFMEWAGMDENTAIENPLINKSIENAQVRVEGYHFDMRKHLVEFDDVVNQQRELIYGERRKILSGADLRANILTMVKEELAGIADAHLGHEYEPDLTGFIQEAGTILPLPSSFNAQSLEGLARQEIEGKLEEMAEALYREKEKEIGPENMRLVERMVMLRVIDNLWVEHLTNMEYMREGIGLQAIAQRDPLVAYKRQGGDIFDELLGAIRHDVTHTIYRVAITKPEAPRKPPVAARPATPGPQPQRQAATPLPPHPASHQKVGRNEPCPCGSGKKYKHCCGK